jgi:hypothetical protein
MQHQGSADELLAKWSPAPGDVTLPDGRVGPGRLDWLCSPLFGVGTAVSLMTTLIWRLGVIAHLASQVGSAANTVHYTRVAGRRFEGFWR